MKVKILPSAIEDLALGRQFYERLGVNLGIYFFDSLFSDIDSLSDCGGHSSKTGRLTCTVFIYNHIFLQ